jgi:hypothetical protein
MQTPRESKMFQSRGFYLHGDKCARQGAALQVSNIAKK